LSEMSMEAPWEVVPQVRERPPPLSETSMAGPLGGDAENLRAPTIIVGDVDGDPLGGDAGSPRAPTTIVRDVDGGPPRR
jgi:hypothetical protein